MKKNKEGETITTWEAYNYILHGLSDELLALGVDPAVKRTIFQLWTAYLSRMKIAFFDLNKETLPKLPESFRKRDVNVLLEARRKRKISEQNDDDLFETEDNEKHPDTHLLGLEPEEQLAAIQDKKNQKPKSHRNAKQTMSRLVLFTIIYCALNQHQNPIQISDLLRYLREEHLTFNNCKKFLPKHLTKDFIGYMTKLYSNNHEVRIFEHREFSISVKQFHIFCDVAWNPPDLLTLCERYVRELQLPKDVFEFVKKIYEVSPPKLRENDLWEMPMPFYEARAMAYILFVLKLIFGLDGKTEIQLSKSALEINSTLAEMRHKKRLFVWTEWVEYLNARKLFVAKYHGATFFKNETKDEQKESRFHYLEVLRQENEQEIEIVDDEKGINLQKIFQDIRELRKLKIETLKFSPSLTPYTDAVELLKTTYRDQIDHFPKILEVDHASRDVKSLIKHSELRNILKKYGHNLSTLPAESNENIKFVDVITDEMYIKLVRLSNAPLFSNLCFDIGKSDWKSMLAQELEEEKSVEKQEEKRVHDKLKQEFDLLNDRIKERKTKTNLNESNTDSEGHDAEYSSVLTLLTPHFDYWVLMANKSRLHQNLYQKLVHKFPATFHFLLEECANLLEAKAFDCYIELLTIETQFIYVLKSMNLVESELLYHDVDRLPKKLCRAVKQYQKNISGEKGQCKSLSPSQNVTDKDVL